MQQKKQYISLARILAAIFIITLHTVETYGMVSDELYWLEANIIVAIAECGVPIFFMITGATLIDYKDRYSTKEFFKRRMHSVILPLGIWYLIANIYGIIMQTEAMKFPYWFFFVLVGMYLCIPLFASVQKESRERVCLYIVAISFVINYLIPFIADVFHLTIKARFPFDIGAGYLIYVLIGYLIHKKEISMWWRMTSYSFAVLGFGMKVIGTYILSLESGELDGTFGHYANVPCFLIAVGMFIFLKQIGSKINKKKQIKCLDFFSGCTMASYVLHQYVSCYIIGPYLKDIYSLVYNLGAPILNFMICVGITCLLRKIPLIKKLVP